jgi:hypothetical protein
MGVGLMDVGEDRAIVAVARGEATPDDEDIEDTDGSDVAADADPSAATELASEDAVTAVEGEVHDELSDTVGDESSESTDE